MSKNDATVLVYNMSRTDICEIFEKFGILYCDDESLSEIREQLLSNIFKGVVTL
jgi:hypothetical protein